MRFIEAGLKLLKSFEGCKLEAYQDQKGVWTIGWGCTRDVVEGLTIDQAEADFRLMNDVRSVSGRVMSLVKAPITDNQFTAMVCFAYNVGTGALRDSMLLQLVNAKRYQEAAEEFMKWSHITVDGQKIAVDGLLKRRKAERDLFLSA